MITKKELVKEVRRLQKEHALLWEAEEDEGMIKIYAVLTKKDESDGIYKTVTRILIKKVK